MSRPLRLVCTLALSTAFASNLWGGDLLRGGGATNPTFNGRGRLDSRADALAERTAASQNDALSRTTQALQSVRNLQEAARQMATVKSTLPPMFNGRPLPAVPNGLRPGGLQVDPDVLSGNVGLWQGARLPRETKTGPTTRVVIQQTEQMAILNWRTFNVGKDTSVHFNQSAGGNRRNEWIAFNKINDPSGSPTQILGAIKAEGQVYVINRNGIIFGGASAIDVHTLVASTLPINDQLVRQGLLNNRDAQFLFSSLPVPGGSDGALPFNPTINDPDFRVAPGAETYALRDTLAVNSSNAPVREPVFSFVAANGARTALLAGTDYTLAIDAGTKRATATFTAAGLTKVNGAPVRVTYTPTAVRSGDVLVQPGARISTPVSADGNGGRIMLVGPNVRNEGTLSTPAGQAILAAGQQVGIAAHASSDPSLRGLDVWVGAVDALSGTAANTGLIEAYTGNAVLTGRTVEQLGVIESSTTVDLNGRIDLRASYGAVANPGFDNTGEGGGKPPFFYQNTGTVTLGPRSVTRILPDYTSESTVPGTSLPQRSQINVEGHAVQFRAGSLMLAPNADVTVRAGVWPYRDVDGNRTVLNADGQPEPNLQVFAGATQRFLFSGGQIHLDPTAMINVAGSTEVFVPLAHSILEVEFRGAELADSPLQRGGVLRGIPLTVDLRQSGVYEGRFWQGTPLGDATGLAGLIQRNAAQLTAAGGNVTLQAGQAIVTQPGSIIDVSGGYFRHEAGLVKTTRLWQGGRLVDIADAVPDQVYEGVFTGTFTVNHPKYGISQTYATPFMTGERFEPAYVQGAAGGSLRITAPSTALDGEMLGLTVPGPRQRIVLPPPSRLAISFTSEKVFQVPGDTAIDFLTHSPTPPAVVFSSAPQRPAEPLRLADTTLAPLREDRVSTVVLSPELLEEKGFGHLTVENPDGSIAVPAGIQLTAPARGAVSLTAARLDVAGDVSAPGGQLSFRVLNFSPTFVTEFPLLNTVPVPLPAPNPGRGTFTLASGATLSTAGLVVDDRLSSRAPLSQPLVLDGGSISIESFSADLKAESTINVSGGAEMNAAGRITYGAGGSISILTGRDPGFRSVVGGGLRLGSTLQGYSGARGGSLSLRSNLIHIGGGNPAAGALVLTPEFFRTGGFTSYSLAGIGAPGATADTYLPAIQIAAGTQIAPVAEQWLALPHATGAREVVLQHQLNETGLRSPVSLSFGALGVDDSFTTGILEIRGDIAMGAGARIVTDPGASVSFVGQTVSLLGSVSAPGGSITVKGDDRLALAPDPDATRPFAQATVYLGPQAELSTAGTAVTVPDLFGRRLGTLFAGGTISISGNIVASHGSVLDVSGAATTFDLHPSLRVDALPGSEQPTVRSGVTTPLWRLQSVPTQVESNGGLIDLQGGEMLFADSTLRGRAGGPTAIGGTLSIFSGRFYPNPLRKTSEINLVVTQSGDVIPSSNRDLGIGKTVFGANGAALPGMGYFAADRAMQGGFDSLDLGFKFLDSAAPVPFGGNVEFRGPVSITLPGSLRVAAGGVIQADSTVRLTAAYAALGQPFRPPLHPDDPAVELFQQVDANGTPTLYFPPIFGPGSLHVTADLIDVGNLSLQGIGRAALVADGGDIRGNGTLNLAGDLTLRAAQIYPTTLADFRIFAYDHARGAGSVRIVGSGEAAAPLSAGGRLGIFASHIVQGGTLRAPSGSITLGWDGTDTDPSDAALDAPFDPITNGTVTVPTTRRVTLLPGSLTSVAALDAAGPMLIPFGLSPDGSSWIDPRGVDVTISGVPQKQIAIAGDRVTTRAGSTIDIRGGGDLSAYRWVRGPGGSIDLTGTAATEWNPAASYAAGDLVSSGGRTWSARVATTGEQPASSISWSLVPESFAIVPNFRAGFAPYAPFNTRLTAAALGGDPGYVSTLRLGESIALRDVPGLADGTYTLLPRRYALLPGAFLVTPTNTAPLGTLTLPDGMTLTSAYQVNRFTSARELPTVRSQYRILSSEALRERAEYDDYLGDAFFTAAALRSDVSRLQRLPGDAGYLSLHGNLALRPEGMVLGSASAGARGALVDLSSFADMYVVGGSGRAPAGAGVVLRTNVLNSWGIESLLIGGLRQRGASETTIDARTKKLVIDNAGSLLRGPEVILVSEGELALADGAAVAAAGPLSEPSDRLQITGDGALLRLTGDLGARFNRTGVTGANTALLAIGAGVALASQSLTLDSSYGTSIDPTAILNSEALALGSGQISILLQTPAGGLVGSEVTPHLQLSGGLLDTLRDVRALTLRSYRTIDFYGTGSFATAGSLSLFASGLRGYEQAGGPTTIEAGSVLFANPSNVAALAAPAISAGTLEVNAAQISFGNFNFAVSGFDNVRLNASAGVSGRGSSQQVGNSQVSPTFLTTGNLTITTPVITSQRGGVQAIEATGDLRLERAAGFGTATGGLGSTFHFTAGGALAANTRVALPSGQITLRAKGGDVTVGGDLDVSGTVQTFADLTRVSSAGTITLTSETGNVSLLAGSRISVAAPAIGGQAGTLTVEAGQGAFSSAGAEILGSAAADGESGRFRLDAGSLGSYADLSTALNAGGFLRERTLRIRSGDITIADVGGQASRARDFTVSTDLGAITVTGRIDASGRTGGSIALIAGGSLTLDAGAALTARGEIFNSAGKGGDIRLEAGAAVNGVSQAGATLTVTAGSTIDLGVDAFVAGDYTQAPQSGNPGSSAFYGQFQGTLHLRAARSGNDVSISSLAGNILGASSVLVEGYRIYSGNGPAGDRLDIALRDQMHADNLAYINAGGAAMTTRLLTGSTLDPNLLVVAPGVEIINLNGDLQLGTPNNANGTATALTTADWNLSNFRYGPKLAPGVLTLRARGDLIFNNTLSDGFTPVVNTAANGNSTMWLAQLMNINPALPTNTQSWSYRLAAGADLSSASFRATLPSSQLAVGKGSLLLGEFYAPVPNTSSTATGSAGLTANTIRISTTNSDQGTRFEVIRTGTGSIDIATGRDVQLRNQFATIYTAGVRLPQPQTVFQTDDFRAPNFPFAAGSHPSQSQLGSPQQFYGPSLNEEGTNERIAQYAMAGGNLRISAANDIGRFTRINGNVIADSSLQLPTNWLYRRGYVDPVTGLVGTLSSTDVTGTIFDVSASTTWWIDYSNFFQGVGTLGGGDVEVEAGRDVINLDALAPTNARMAGRLNGVNVAPDAARLLEHGGGDVTINAGRNIDGGIYYVERGKGTLTAGGEIKTNAARSPSLRYLQEINNPNITLPESWLPTTLFLGKGQFDVSAAGNILLGPTVNPFLMPQGVNNKFWYKTYFNTYASDSAVRVTSLGGDITHRHAVLLQGQPASPLAAYLDGVHSFRTSATNAAPVSAAFYQPWIRLAEAPGSISAFAPVFAIQPPTLISTSFAGNVNLLGESSLFPSATGTLEIVAGREVIGLQKIGVNGAGQNAFSSATINVSDASPGLVPGVLNPAALYGRLEARETSLSLLASGNLPNPLLNVDLRQIFTESGSFTGSDAAITAKQARHAASILHAEDREPVRIYAQGGDIAGLTLFTPKAAQILAQRDLTDVALYLQNATGDSISIVSAGRDIVPFNETSGRRALADSGNNVVVDISTTTVTGRSTNALAGDIQINGPGVLQVLAGRNLDLGFGENFIDGRGVGITSIGNLRNPYLPNEGADMIVLAGISSRTGGGAALGLANSTLDFESFDAASDPAQSPYLTRLESGRLRGELSAEQEAIVGLEQFFATLRAAGRAAAESGDYSEGFAAIDAVFGSRRDAVGEIFTRSREIRTALGGAISIGVPGGGVTMAADIFGNPLTPPGIVTAAGGPISVFTDGSVNIGSARIFTLRGGDILMWSSNGDIAAGNAPRTVVTAPPTRVLIEATSATVQTDLGGLATGGGIGVLAAVKGVPPGDVDLIAPSGTVDAGDAGIRVTGNINIAASAVLNAGNIQVGGTSTGVPAAAPPVAPPVSAAPPPPPPANTPNPVQEELEKRREQAKEEPPSIIEVDILDDGSSNG